ncbi:GNAT family N-acetyltransferase [uncultured Polaribacter sp.]|uniref:GNAT family N-acetyltransferase n=1 Tax=uncultured Polaribacter sp. TaxID=174711 RepID=UPI002630FB47|nr:GNAT family N-acetyltransferase [uncultured Polaribacter sp.]
MNIQNSILEDVDEILKLYKQARALQTNLKMVIWPEFSREMIVQEIKEKKQFKIIINHKIACVWAIAFSDPLIWEEKNKDAAIYIHRIATNKEIRGNNLVQKMVAWSKIYAKKNSYNYVRLDTVGENRGLINHYKKCGFHFLGLSKLNNTNSLPAHYKNATVSLFEIKL